MSHCRGERGSVLLAVLLVALALGVVGQALAEGVRQLALEVDARNDVLCARYAAFAGLALGAASGDQASEVDARVAELTVGLLLRRADWCVLVSQARCGDAQRRLEITVPVEHCTG